MLAFSGFHDRDARITSAIASNVWAAYEKHGNNSFREDRLQYLIINCEGGKVIVSQVNLDLTPSDRPLNYLPPFQVANLLLCLYANQDVGLGILKTKITKLKESLESPLREIST